MDRWKTVRRMGLSHGSMLSFMFGTQTQSSTSGQARVFRHARWLLRPILFHFHLAFCSEFRSWILLQRDAFENGPLFLDVAFGCSPVQGQPAASPPLPPFLDRGWVLRLAMCNSVESHASDLVIRSSSKPSSSRTRRTFMTDNMVPCNGLGETRADLGASQYPHGAPSGCSSIHVGVHIRLLALLFIQRSSLSAKSPGAPAFCVCHRHARCANKTPEAWELCHEDGTTWYHLLQVTLFFVID